MNAQGSEPPPDPVITVARMDGGDPLVIPHARRVAEALFAIDPSSRTPANPKRDKDGDLVTHSYDDWSLETPPNEILRYDVKVLNKGMRARSQPARWDALFHQPDLPWLAAVGVDWDLLTMSQPDWQDRDAANAIQTLVVGILRPYINVSVATKMLHLKRPAFVPVLDKLVLAQLGGYVSQQAQPAARAGQVRDVLDHVRTQGASESRSAPRG
jgi:Family of unknown function (DUF6308)